jgi:hypothetical protein
VLGHFGYCINQFALVHIVPPKLVVKRQVDCRGKNALKPSDLVVLANYHWEIFGMLFPEWLYSHIGYPEIRRLISCFC